MASSHSATSTKSAPTYHLTLDMQEFPGVVLRGHHVLINLRDTRGNYILGRKNIYPEGISRFVGGAIEGDEAPPQAAQRELAEETGLDIPLERLTPTATVIASITDQHDRSITFTTYLFTTVLSEAEVAQLAAGDDLDDSVTLSLTQFEQLINRYGQLPMTIDPDKHFAWGDYGQLYGYIHELALPTSTR